MDHGSVNLCRDDPGEDATLIVESSVLTLTEICDRDAEEMIRQHKLRVIGSARGARDPWCRLGRSAFAQTRESARARA